MLPLQNAGTFAIAALVLILIPGPSVLFAIGRSLSIGRLGGFVSVLGNGLGMIPAIAAVALGLGTIVSESVLVFSVIKFAGAAYLVYLGIQTIRRRNVRADDGDSTDVAAKSVRGPLALIGQGFLVGISNPKTIVFFVAVLPQFVDRSAANIPLQFAVLGAIFVAIGIACDSVWVLTATAARTWFARNPRRLSRIETSGGVIMIGLGGVLALSGNKH
jgi:threonine/homoserine/homoserine lactone efflux protein